MDLSVLKNVFAYALPYKSKIYASIFLSIILAVLSPLRPYLIQYTVNVFIKDKNMQWLILITIIQIGMLLLETAAGLLNLPLQGGVRIRALLLEQDSAALSAINAAVAEGMDQLFRKEDRFQVPMPAILGSGVKPRQQ